MKVKQPEGLIAGSQSASIHPPKASATDLAEANEVVPAGIAVPTGKLPDAARSLDKPAAAKAALFPWNAKSVSPFAKSKSVNTTFTRLHWSVGQKVVVSILAASSA